MQRGQKRKKKMIVDINKKILIVGLGLLGGSYAKVLKRFGFHISAITLEQRSIDYGSHCKMQTKLTK